MGKSLLTEFINNYNCGYENFEFAEISRNAKLTLYLSVFKLYSVSFSLYSMMKRTAFFVKYNTTNEIFKPKSILLHKRYRKPKGQPRINNLKTLITLGT